MSLTRLSFCERSLPRIKFVSRSPLLTDSVFAGGLDHFLSLNSRFALSGLDRFLVLQWSEWQWTVVPNDRLAISPSIYPCRQTDLFSRRMYLPRGRFLYHLYLYVGDRHPADFPSLSLFRFVFFLCFIFFLFADATSLWSFSFDAGCCARASALFCFFV